MGKSHMAIGITIDTYNMRVYDVLFDSGLNRVLDDLFDFRDHRQIVLIMEGGENITNQMADYLVEQLEDREFKLVVVCNDIDQVPWALRKVSIECYFPPATQQQIQEFVKWLNEEVVWDDLRGVRDYRTAMNVIEAGGGTSWPDIVAPFKDVRSHFQYAMRFVDDRQLLADINLLSRDIYRAELLKDVRVINHRPYVYLSKVKGSIAKKLGKIIKDSKRERLRYIIPLIMKMTNPSILFVLQGLDFTDRELQVLEFKKVKALKRDFKAPVKPPPKGEDIDKYF